MTLTAEQLLSSALKLPESERFELAGALLPSSSSEEFTPVGDEWIQEFEQRTAEIDAGSATLTPWKIVRERVEKRVDA